MRGVGAGRGRTIITVPMATIRDATMAGVIAVGIAGKQLHLRMTEKGGPAGGRLFYMSTLATFAARSETGFHRMNRCRWSRFRAAL